MFAQTLDYPVKYVWLFLTNRCPLNCDYCFFKYRHSRKTISFQAIETLCRALSKERKYEFVISGGEPLMEWGLAQKTIKLLKSAFPGSPVVLQSNMLLWDAAKRAFAKKQDIIVEPGIDGALLSNRRHRRGISKPLFKKINGAIRLAIKKGIEVTPTLTVHPDEVPLMLKNFMYLHSLGIKRADVHPAFLEDWKEGSIVAFEKMYKIVLGASKKYDLKVCDCYNVPIPCAFDLIVQPDGNVLPNWIYLAFPEKIKKEFFIMHIGEKKISVNARALKRMLCSYKRLFSGSKTTYREFSNHNARMALKLAKDKRLRSSFSRYEKICEFIHDQDHLLLHA